MTTVERDEVENPRRTSVWSVSEGWLTAYFALFTIQFITGVSLVIWYETAVVTQDAPAGTLMNIFWRAGPIPILSASTSYIFAEGGRLTMVISNWIEKKLEERRIKHEQALIEQGRKEGIKEGFEQGRAFERKLIDAESNGANGNGPSAKDEE